MLEVQVRLDRGGFGIDAAFTKNRGVTAVFGPSGAGKTTLAHLVAGLLRPDSGRIRFGGQVLFDSEAKVWIPARQRRIGCDQSYCGDLGITDRCSTMTLIHDFAQYPVHASVEE